MQILITDNKGVQNIYDTESDRLGAGIKFMRGWSLEKIQEYCNNKKWKVDVLTPPPNFYDYGDV
jgi:hypothetical protein